MCNDADKQLKKKKNSASFQSSTISIDDTKMNNHSVCSIRVVKSKCCQPIPIKEEDQKVIHKRYRIKLKKIYIHTIF